MRTEFCPALFVVPGHRSGADSRVQTWNFRSDRDGSCGTVPSDASGHERLDPVSFAIHAQVCCCSQALMISRATLGMDGDPGPADDWTPLAPPSGSASLVGCDEAELSGGGLCPALLRGFVVSFCLRCAHSRASARAHTNHNHTLAALSPSPPSPQNRGALSSAPSVHTHETPSSEELSLSSSLVASSNHQGLTLVQSPLVLPACTNR